ncbi:glycosyltransferase [Halobacteriovorax sp. JY17]|uniref:glycosyltransferase n=1 Tax=Halobacteriovorax sp. JY17 TaxID=2014617 RepID=UPI000C6AB0BB|nr:glycosyltransferase [Halobacteriovorax sp. JY17]PIK14031.1 MAG: hypothetical protein CES88_13690 [Halobacteriovorax sp. JY17]
MTKIKRDSIQNDPCIISINTLRERCENFFLENSNLKSTCRVYIDDPYEQSLGSDKNEVVDFILFGNAFKKFFESGNWIGKEIRIWVLSESNKKILESYLENRAEVNVIPRYLLFPVKQSLLPFLVGTEHTFVFAGRLSAQKNIESLLYFIKNYNEKYKVNSILQLYGDFEDTYHEDLGRRFQESYRTKILKLVDTLDISRSVKFHGRVERDTWIKSNITNPVFISLSTFVSEDFGCAVAEAQQIGWPVIVSEYGGHLDIRGENIRKVPVSFICNSHYPLSLQSIVSNKLVDSLEKLPIEKEKLNVEDSVIKHVSLDLIDECRRKMALKLGASLSLIHSDYVGAFADTSQGASFFYKIKCYMKNPQKHISIIAYDFDEKDFSEEQIKSFNLIYSNLNLLEVGVEFISSKNIFYKDTMKIILESEKIYIVRDRLNKEDLDSYLKKTLHISTESIVYE